MIKSVSERLKLSNILKRIIFFSIVSIFVIAFDISASQAKETCYSLYCVEAVTNNGVTSIYLRNTQTYDMTISVKFTTLENVEPDVEMPFVETVAPGKRVNAMNLNILDKRKKWRYQYLTLGIKGSVDAEHDDDYVYSLPYASGKTFKVSQGFNGTFSHNGEQSYAVDWSMPVGTPIYAARDGIVVGVQSKNTIGGADKKFAEYANYIYIKHSDETIGAYLHLKQNGVKVKLGQKVEAGQQIGLSGNTGWSGGPHLHFWVYKVREDGAMRESIPITFETSTEDEAVLLKGKSYTAP